MVGSEKIRESIFSNTISLAFGHFGRKKGRGQSTPRMLRVNTKSSVYQKQHRDYPQPTNRWRWVFHVMFQWEFLISFTNDRCWPSSNLPLLPIDITKALRPTLSRTAYDSVTWPCVLLGAQQ